ncbi:VanZ family protein [Paracoccus sp. MC1862]|nr:VanZ family protein [Paracoccus sp. MC1862]
MLIAVVIAVATMTPITAPELPSFEHTDKIYHALAFAGLAFPVALFRSDWLILAIPVYAAFGGLIEIIQPFVGRECSYVDWIADLIGLGLGIVVGLAVTVVAGVTRQFRLRSLRFRAEMR